MKPSKRRIDPTVVEPLITKTENQLRAWGTLTAPDLSQLANERIAPLASIAAAVMIVDAVERFDEASSRINRGMIWLSVLMATLTLTNLTVILYQWFLR